jgi:hypothetical protein
MRATTAADSRKASASKRSGARKHNEGADGVLEGRQVHS